MSQPLQPPNVVLMRTVFDWFNSFMAGGPAPARADVEAFFAPGARMITNGVVKCVGVEALLNHFNEARSRLARATVGPLEVAMSQGDVVAARYVLDHAGHDGSAGRTVAAAFWTIEDGRVAELLEYVYYTGDVLKLSHYD